MLLEFIKAKNPIYNSSFADSFRDDNSLQKKVKHVQVPLETQLGKSIQLPADWLLH